MLLFNLKDEVEEKMLNTERNKQNTEANMKMIMMMLKLILKIIIMKLLVMEKGRGRERY